MFSPEVNDEFLRVCLNLLQLGPGLLQLTLIQESSIMQKILHSVHIQYTSQQRNKNQRMICYKCESSGADWYILTKKTGAFYTKHDFFLYNTEDDVEAATTEIRAVSGTVASRRAEAANAGAAPAGGRPRQAVDSSPWEVTNVLKFQCRLIYFN